MKKYLVYYETAWPDNIAELTAVENKPFVGYLGGTKEVKYTVIPEHITGPLNNEIWYTSKDGNVVNYYKTGGFGANIVSNTYENDKGIITFDGPVTSIETEAFKSSYSLTSIIIPNSVTSIGHRAFLFCWSLSSVTIPNSVTSIGQHAFSSCSSLTSITFDGTMEELAAITKYALWNGPATYVQCTDGQVTL